MIEAVYDRSEWWAGWVAAKIGLQCVPPYYAIGFVNERGEMQGAVVFYGHTGEDIEITIVGLWSRQMFRIIADYVFKELKCQRMTARTRPTNKKVIRVMEAAGFHREGLARKYYPGGDDAILFGMLPEECRFLPKEKQ